MGGSIEGDEYSDVYEGAGGEASKAISTEGLGRLAANRGGARFFGDDDARSMPLATGGVQVGITHGPGESSSSTLGVITGEGTFE